MRHPLFPSPSRSRIIIRGEVVVHKQHLRVDVVHFLMLLLYDGGVAFRLFHTNYGRFGGEGSGGRLDDETGGATVRDILEGRGGLDDETREVLQSDRGELFEETVAVGLCAFNVPVQLLFVLHQQGVNEFAVEDARAPGGRHHQPQHDDDLDFIIKREPKKINFLIIQSTERNAKLSLK